MAWLNTEQALAVLGTKPQSLYASVSRGRIRARPDPNDPRKSLYDHADIERLAARGGGGRRKATTVAAETIRWGDPVLPSSVSTVTGGQLYYRGRNAVDLAQSVGLEEVAALLWEAPRTGFSSAAHATNAGAVTGLGGAFAVMAARAASDPPAFRQPAPALAVNAAQLVGVLAIALGAPPGEAPLHRRLAAAWRRPELANVLRTALVLLADHELNASTFAARIAASTGAPLAGAVLAGLATLNGPLHGGASAEVTRLVTLAEREGPAAIIRAPASGSPAFATGRALTGFGHRLYPDGDPRAETLLAQLPLPAAYAAFAALARDLTGEAPNVDFALAALGAAYDLPAAAPLQLFALARSVGWLAHAMEQLQTGTLIRPRATYVGVPPALP